MILRIGTSGYSYKEWKGVFYPENLKPAEMLSFYATRLGTVEINNTFYHMPTPKVIEGWASQVPESFRFVLKTSQKITHFKRLKGVEEEAEYVVRMSRLRGLGWARSWCRFRPTLPGTMSVSPLSLTWFPAQAFRGTPRSWMPRARECMDAR